MVAKYLKRPKALEKITKKLLAQNDKEVQFFMVKRHRLHIYFGILFENLFLIAPERDELPLRIVLCEEILYDLTNGLWALLQAIRNHEKFVKITKNRLTFRLST